MQLSRTLSFKVADKARAAPVSRCNWAGEAALKLAHVAAGKLQFLANPPSPLGRLVTQQLTCPPHQGSWAGGWGGEKERRKVQRGGERKEGWIYSFCNPISGMTSHHFCCILVTRNESLGLAHTQGKGITERHQPPTSRLEQGQDG